MDGMTLLEQARLAGLTVIVQGDKLIIRGPRRAGSVAEQLLAHKGEVIDPTSLDCSTADREVARSGPTTPMSIGAWQRTAER